MTSRRIKGNHGNRLAESDSSVKLYDRCGIKKPMRKEQLEAQIEKVKAELLKLGPMRPGSLSQQYSACQKPGCKCVDPVHPQKHGPFYQLSYTHGGKSTTQFVRPPFVPEAQAARRLQEIQSSHPPIGHAGPRPFQTRNA